MRMKNVLKVSVLLTMIVVLLAVGSAVSSEPDSILIIFESTGTGGASEGWVDDGYTVRLTTETDSVGIGISTPTQKLDVDGYIKGTGLCIGSDCKSDWGSVTGIGGSGDVNYISKFTGTGSSIGSSQIFDDGTNVGIGTTSPDKKLHIDGALKVSNVGDPSILLNYDSDGSNGSWTIYANDSDERLSIVNGDANLTLRTSGNVGIGTTSPSVPLHIYRASGDANLWVQTASGGTFIDINSTNGYRAIRFKNSGAVSSAIGRTVGPSANTIDFMVGGETVSDSKMRIDEEGKVGIGTTNPPSLLTVKDQIRIARDMDTYGYVSKIVSDGSRLDIGYMTSADTWYGGSPIMSLIASSGKIGIGTINPTERLVVSGGANSFVRFDAASGVTGIRLSRADIIKWGILNNHPSTDALSIYQYDAGVTRFTINSSGNVIVANLSGSGNRSVYSTSNGTLTNTSSDKRLKTNIKDITSELDIIHTLKKLRGVYYNWNTDIENTRDLGNQREIGMIAQEVESVMPELVGTNSNGYKSLDYPKLSAFLIEVDKMQQTEIEELKILLNQQHKQIEVQQARIDKLESLIQKGD